MADVTDAAYRRIIAKYGKPQVMYTEFVSCDGLMSEKGRPNLLRDLWYDESERPIVAQIFGENPDNFYKCAQFLVGLGFDGIDINMGCPTQTVCDQEAGAYLIKRPEIAKEVIAATKAGAGDIPISVKTRIGYSAIQLEEWLGCLLEAKPAAIALHLRTRKEMSKVPAHWDQGRTAVVLAKESGTLLIGNGDVKNLTQARELARGSGMDGVMLGRAIFGNPWLFDETRRPEDISIKERLATMVEHATLYEELFAGKKPFLLMRKHLQAYCAGFRGAKDFRVGLQSINCAQDVIDAVTAFRLCLDGAPLEPPTPLAPLASAASI